MNKFVNYGLFSINIRSAIPKIENVVANDLWLENTPTENILIYIEMLGLEEYCKESNDDLTLEIKKKNRISITVIRIEKKVICIKVYLSSNKSKLSRLISSSFQDDIEMSVADFIHGPYLSILSSILPKYDGAIVHSACAEIDNRYIAVIGGSQSGKTTLVKQLDKVFNAKILSEDFVIMKKKGGVTPLQLSLRRPVIFNDILKIKSNFIEIMNFMLFEFLAAFTRTSAFRRVKFDIYFDRVDCLGFNEVELFYFSRNELDYSESTEAKIAKLMIEEFENFLFISEIQDFLFKKGFLDKPYCKVSIFDYYINFFKDKNLDQIYIPFLSDRSKLAYEFLKMIKEV